MIVLGKSSKGLSARDLKQYLVSRCPIRLFKNINLITDGQELQYCFRIPSKTKLNLNSVKPVDEQFCQYLCDNELNINKLAQEQWMTQSLRGLQMDTRNVIKQFCAELTPEQIERYSPRITSIQKDIELIVPHVTRNIMQYWSTEIRKPLYKKFKQVSL